MNDPVIRLLALFVAIGAVACGTAENQEAKDSTAVEKLRCDDSTAAATASKLAMYALDSSADATRLFRVHQVERSDSGYVVTLVMRELSFGGGGRVFIRFDGTTTVLELSR